MQETLEHQKDQKGDEIKAGIQTPFDLNGNKGVSLSQYSGILKPRESKTISITARTDNLEAGHSYSTTLIFTKVGGGTSTSVPIPVLYYVTTCSGPLYDGGPKPPCDLPIVLNIPLAQGFANLDFTNDPENAQLSPVANGRVTWQLSSDEAWLTTNPTTASFVANEKAHVVVTAHGAGLSSGQTAHLTLKLKFDPNPPQFVETDKTVTVVVQ